MSPEEAFEAWAPAGPEWSAWARPVLFALAGPGGAAPPAAEEAAEAAGWAPGPAEGVAVVVDLPGAVAARVGLALARRGYRPVPLFNGAHHEAGVVPTGELVRALFELAPAVRAAAPPPDAPPAFLLDSRRLEGAADLRPGRFDNRWVTLPQDFPSAARLLSRGLRRVLLVQEGRDRPRDDLAHVLRRYQDAGIALRWQDPSQAGGPRDVRVGRPGWFRFVWYRLLAVLGLRRNSAGGFGGLVPELPSGG
jgi:hypothetical protein